MTYYLQHGMIDNATRFESERYVLDDHAHMKCEHVRAIEAPDWKAARRVIKDSLGSLVEA